jgi:putative transposase
MAPVYRVDISASISPALRERGAVFPINGRLLDELLNETLVSSLAHAREAVSLWKDHYNTIRPHSGLGNLTPAAYIILLHFTRPG